MRYNYTALVLATFSIGQVFASPFKHLHGHFHAKKEAEALNFDTTLTTRSTSALSSGHSIKLLDELKFKSLGLNSENPSDGVWLGSDGPYTNEFHNESGEDLIVVVWGSQGSWVNAVAPHITISLANGTSKVVSFAKGQSGAWAAIYDATKMLNGQISNTWGEYTFDNFGVVDVSREPNMKGNKMTIVGPQCVTDMDTCVFVCSEGDTCTYGYELKNCATGSQPGAQYGTYGGAPSGGCGGFGDKAALHTYLSS